MIVTMISIVIGALSFIQKLEDLEIREQVETIQTTTWLRTARIPRRVQETCCHSDPSEKPPVNADEKKFQKRKKNVP